MNPTNEQELRAKIDTAFSPIEELLFPTGYEEAEYGDPTEAMDKSMALGSALEKLEALIQAHTNAEIAKVLDRLEAHWTPALVPDGEHPDGKSESEVVPLSAIKAERAKLKEIDDE